MRLLTALFVLFLTTFAAAQTLTPAEISKVDGVFAQYAKPDSPGCALGIYRNGSMAYEHGYGLASLELGVPITADTVFDIGSTSKQFTAFTIQLLQDRGKLSIDDDIHKFIPEFPNYGHEITLRHLLSHTSGIRDYTALFGLAGVPEQNLTTDQDALDLILRQKALNFNPGEEWDYSNSGFFLLSQVVKHVSGQTLRQFDQENIFTPLGMSSTQIFDNHAQVVPRRATGYTYDGGNKTFGVEMSNFEQTGDGSVQTSVRDLLKWDENFYTAKIGGAEVIRRMQVVGKLTNGQEHGYGTGLFISTYRGQPIVSHGGAWAGYRAELLRFPRQHTSVAVLCNVAQGRPSKRARQVADIVLENVLQPEPAAATKHAAVAVSADQLRSYAGVYKNEKGQYHKIEAKDGKLWLATYGIELVPQSPTVFRSDDLDATISFSSKQMVIEERGEKPKTYIRVLTEKPGDLSLFAGDYYSPELDATWEIRLRDGALTAHAKHDPSPPAPLDPISSSLFFVSGGTIQFDVQPGKPGHAIVSFDRIRNLDFAKTN
jgi:CubicO group peptidase (beta-lactamase class C family)